MNDFRAAEEALAAAERRLDDDLARLREDAGDGQAPRVQSEDRRLRGPLAPATLDRSVHRRRRLGQRRQRSRR